jgi:hypothetical protein
MNSFFVRKIAVGCRAPSGRQKYWEVDRISISGEPVRCAVTTARRGWSGVAPHVPGSQNSSRDRIHHKHLGLSHSRSFRCSQEKSEPRQRIQSIQRMSYGFVFSCQGLAAFKARRIFCLNTQWRRIPLCSTF